MWYNRIVPDSNNNKSMVFLLSLSSLSMAPRAETSDDMPFDCCCESGTPSWCHFC